uniref:ribosomal protein L10 n=1 Tax=Zygnema cf. cylindricum TaxID=3142258 RepID=UPI0031F4541A
MKKRHSILQYKLQQIETQYQYIFVFHCSGLTNTQWRQLKQLLSITKANTLFQPSRRVKPQAISADKRRERTVAPLSQQSFARRAPKLCKLATKLGVQSQGVTPRPFAPFFGGSLFKRVTHFKQESKRIVVGGLGSFTQFNSKLTSIRGPICIVYSTQTTTSSPNASPSEASKAALLTSSVPPLCSHFVPWLELLKQIGYCEHKANLVLLYARFNSTIINHIDIKQAKTLETKSVLQLFLWSMQYPAQHFDLCLNQGTSNLIQYVTQSNSSARH